MMTWNELVQLVGGEKAVQGISPEAQTVIVILGAVTLVAMMVWVWKNRDDVFNEQ